METHAARITKNHKEPFSLTEQQNEYVLSSYAAFIPELEIVKEFETYFPEAVEAFKAEDPTGWRERLSLSVELLYPNHPDFPEHYKAPFVSMRQTHLRSLDDIQLSHAKERIKRYAKRLLDIDARRTNEGEAEFEVFDRCVSLESQLLDKISKEVYNFHEFMTDRSELSEEETKELLEKLSPGQLLEVKDRVDKGESMEQVLLDIRYMVKSNLIGSAEVPNVEAPEKTVETK